MQDFPAGLKPIKKFFMRALELEKGKRQKNDVMAYCFRLYALKKAISDQALQSTEGAQAYLTNLMDTLESDKQELLSKYGDLMSSEEQRLELIKQTGTELFKKATQVYESGKATKKTAVIFNSAATYFEVAGPDDEDMVRARKVAKFNAAEIMKALSEGRTPMPPKAQEEEDEGDDDYGLTSELPAAPTDPLLPAAPSHDLGFNNEPPKNNTPAGFLDLDQSGPRTPGNAPAGSFARDLSTFEDMAPRFGDIPVASKMSVRGMQFMSSRFNARPTGNQDSKCSKAFELVRQASEAVSKNDYEKTVDRIAGALQLLENRKPMVNAPRGLSKPSQSDVAEYLAFAARTLETAGQVMSVEEAKSRSVNLLSNALQILQRG